MASERDTPNVSTDGSARGQSRLGRAMQGLLLCVTSSVPREDRKAARDLAKMKLEMHAAAAWRLGIVLLIGAIAVGFAIRGANVQLIAGILGAGALAVAYIEWLLGRRESSMDKFYDRLVLANNYRREIKTPRKLGISQAKLYVFSELDNLEYVIERYRFGYMSAALALRGVKTFESRLKGIEGFSDLVRRLVTPESGYSEQTRIVVGELLSELALSRSPAGNAGVEPADGSISLEPL